MILALYSLILVFQHKKFAPPCPPSQSSLLSRVSLIGKCKNFVNLFKVAEKIFGFLWELFRFTFFDFFTVFSKTSLCVHSTGLVRFCPKMDDFRAESHVGVVSKLCFFFFFKIYVSKSSTLFPFSKLEKGNLFSDL